MRAGFMKMVRKPAMKRSPARRLGARLRPAIEEAYLMFDEQRLGKDGT